MTTILNAPSADGFQLVLAGNVSPSSFYNGFVSPNSVTTSYDSVNHDTTLYYSGAAITTGQSVTVGFQVAGTNTNTDGIGPPNVLSADFTLGPPSTVVDTADADLTDSIVYNGGPASPTVDYLVLHAQAEPQSGPGDPQYFQEFALPVNESASVFLANETAGTPLTLSSAGYFLSPTLIPLDQLNQNDLPPSRFSPLPGVPDGTQLSPNNGEIEASSAISVSPEPGALALVLAGAASGSVVLRRRRKN